MARKKKTQTMLEETSASAKKTITLDNGAEYVVLSENGKYYVCCGTQFRKSNPRIVAVNVIQEEIAEETSEEIEEEITEKEDVDDGDS